MMDASRRREWQRLKAKIRELEAPEREAEKIAAAQRKTNARQRARENGAKVEQERLKPKGGRVRDHGYVAWCHDSGLSCMPAAMFAMHDTPRTSSPMCRATIASGTVDMPTASAPRTRKARISAGVS